MSAQLNIRYFEEGVKMPCVGKGKDVRPAEDCVIIMQVEDKWVLICNSYFLSNEILTADNNFVSSINARGFERFPHIKLDMECVSLLELHLILRQMRFKLVLPKTVPDWVTELV